MQSVHLKLNLHLLFLHRQMAKFSMMKDKTVTTKDNKTSQCIPEKDGIATFPSILDFFAAAFYKVTL